MNIGIILLAWGIGGTERRFPNLLRYLIKNSKNNYILIINKYLASLLRRANHLDGLEHIVYEIPVDDNILSRFADSPKVIFDSHKFHVPGSNYIICRYRDFLRGRIYNIKKFDWFYDIDIAHITGSYWSNIFQEKTPKVIEAQDSSLKYFNLPIVKQLLSNNENIVNCLSEEIKNNILKRFPGITNRLFVSPCSFIDYSKTRVEKKERIITFSGRLIELKNPMLFINSINKILEKMENVKFYIIGSGYLEDKIKEFVLKHEIEKFVKIGFSYNPINILSKSLVLVSLQTYDNYPSQALMEAMACGCAIVASDVGETWRLVSDDVGFRVPLSADEIAEKIAWLLNHPKQAEEMGRNAREKVMREQTVEKYAKYIEEVYEIAYKNREK